MNTATTTANDLDAVTFAGEMLRQANSHFDGTVLHTDELCMRVLNNACERGWMTRHSVTQVHWTDEGVALARLAQSVRWEQRRHADAVNG